MNMRALGRVKVCAASSCNAVYASVSTTMPEHRPQISSVLINSRAHVSGSRRKKSARRIRVAIQVRRGLFLRRLEINRERNPAFRWLAIAESWYEFGPPEIRDSCVPKSTQRRSLQNELGFFKISNGVYGDRKFHISRDRNYHVLGWIMQTRELRLAPEIWLRTDKVATLVHFIDLLVRGNPQMRFPVFHKVRDGSEEDYIHRSFVVQGRNELRRLEALEHFLLEQLRIGREVIRCIPGNVPPEVHNARKH